MPLLLPSTSYDRMLSSDDVLKRPQRIKSVAVTTVNTNPAICREMWALLQNDGVLEYYSELETVCKIGVNRFTEKSESAQYMWRIPLWRTFNILNRNLYVTVCAFPDRPFAYKSSDCSNIALYRPMMKHFKQWNWKRYFITTVAHVLRTRLVLLEELEVLSC
jgi:hypothetical protein